MELFFLLLILFLLLYFLPWLIALSRGHRNTTAIGVLNIFLGWTLIGWVGALVWSLLNEGTTPTRAS